MDKVLVLASGGLDSSVLLYLYKNLGYDVYLLFFDYGHLSAKSELNHLRKVVAGLGISPNKVITHTISLDWSKSDALKADYYVEMRNLIFISYAMSMAQAKEIGRIGVGLINSPQYYVDASPDFLTLMSNLAMGTTGIVVEAPLINLDKEGVFALGKKLGLRLNQTISCFKPKEDGSPCGECVGCLDVKDVIDKIGVKDEYNPFRSN